METNDSQVPLLDLVLGLIVCIVVVAIGFCLPIGQLNSSDEDKDRDFDSHFYDHM
ncbi:hypothetical protein [Fibrisoma montanum]|uniref:hypothetical protein n=1 Tax=Fibrisoma montanum TaxID=2305895 RepID=UPI001314679C|nr:hypothetical protein [Fibrisoma montanum]